MVGNSSSKKTGVLLINLGTPDSPSKPDVRRYLREFLSDPRVIDLPWLARRLLVECIILPFRTKKSAANYQKIWQASGSPLRFHSEHLAHQLQTALGTNFDVKLAMRYGNPSVDRALMEFSAAQIDKLIVLPLFPQYSGAAWASAAAHVYMRAAKMSCTKAIQMLPSFFSLPEFIHAWSDNIATALKTKPKAHVIFSYHGLPVRQIHAQDSLRQCRLDAACCAVPKPFCYRSQCIATSRLIAERLGLKTNQWTTAFQSRFSGDKWLGPDTDREIVRLAVDSPDGVIIASPSFVVDCLETIEELGMRGREEFDTAGGKFFELVPCLQNSDIFVQGLSRLISQSSHP
jgi:ferrochelatase